MDETLINIIKKPKKENIILYYYEKNFSDLFYKYGIKTYIFFKGEDDITNTQKRKELEKKGIFLRSYKKIKDIKNTTTKEKLKIINVNTFDENFIDTSLKIKKLFGIPLPENLEFFRNKNIQRQLLVQNPNNISAQFIEYKDIQDIDIKNIEKNIKFPLVIKPSNGIQSSLVYKVNDKQDFYNKFKYIVDSYQSFKNKGYKTEKILIEEFIDGRMYSIDYFVNSKGDVFLSKPIKVILGYEIGINDFMNFNRISGTIAEKELENYNLENFIKDNINSAGIKNMFIHHEFKITSKGRLKTIEINGRIGGYRLEMIKESYDFNLLSMLKGNTLNNKDPINNMSVILIYSSKKGILKSFNKKEFNKIKKTDSFYNLNLFEKFLGKKVGLTKDGFKKVGVIKLKNKDSEKLQKDINYINKIYNNLLNIS